MCVLLGALAGLVPAAASAQSTARPLKVVQLGDSYSAGNGAGDYYGPKDCYRSSSNWAERYLDTLRASYNVTFVNRACSGGVINGLTNRRNMDTKRAAVYVPDEVDKDDAGARAALDSRGDCNSRYRDDEAYEITATGAYQDPRVGPGTTVWYDCERYMHPQINAVGRDTDLVLFTIGGNDVEFATIVKECFALGFRDPGTCREKIDAAQDAIGDVGVRTGQFLRTLKSRLRPDAQIVLVTYPYLEKDPDFHLRGGFLFLDNYAVGREIRELGDMGDEGQEAAVAAINAEGGAKVTLLDDVKTHFAGHEPDGRTTSRNPDRWIHEFDTFTMAEWYHFNSTGHQEIANLLGGRPETLPLTFDIEAGGAVDIAFVIDTTGSMGGSIDSVKAAAVDLVNDVAARTSAARFSLVDYRDFVERTGTAGDYPSKLDQDFTSDATTINAAIQGLQLGDGGDWPETMYSGLNTAFNLSWRPGVKKMAIVLADAPPLDPEPYTNLTANDIVLKSLSIDPVEVHVVDVYGGATTDAVRDIATRTNGAIHPTSPSQAAAEIADAIDGSLDQPYAWAAGPYVGKVGETVTLDGRGSYGVTSDIVTFHWVVDGEASTLRAP